MTTYDGIGVALPLIDAFGHGTPAIEVARAAEDAGLDHVWVPDHLVFHRPVLDCLTTLSMAAGATERIGLGTAILNPVLRDPTWLANQLATLAVLSGERLVLGVGLGGEYEPEFVAAGIDRRERGRRLDETLDHLPALLRGEPVSLSGLQRIACPGLAPVPSAVPPILVGGRSEAALRRAARVGDAWFPMWMDPEAVASNAERIAELAQEMGRPAPGLALVAFVNAGDSAAAVREQAAGHIKQQYGMPFERVERWALLGAVEDIAQRLDAYRAVGVTGFCLSPAHPHPLEQVEPIAAIRAALTKRSAA